MYMCFFGGAGGPFMERASLNGPETIEAQVTRPLIKCTLSASFQRRGSAKNKYIISLWKESAAAVHFIYMGGYIYCVPNGRARAVC